MQKTEQHIINKIFVWIFLMFFLFSVIGSHLYLYSTMASISNVLFIGILALLIFYNKTKLTVNQLVIMFPLFGLFVFGLFTLFFIGEYNIEVLKDLFYFSFIPIQLIAIFYLGNKNKLFFYRNAYNLSLYILLFLLIFALFEIITNIHLSSFNTPKTNIPTTFFANPNDLGVFVIGLYMLLMVMNSKSSKKKDLFISIIAGLLIFITLSRTVFIVFLFIAISKYISIKFIKRFIFLFFITGTLLFFVTQIEVPQKSKSAIDRSIIRINSIINYKTQLKTKGNSVNLRIDIYKIPFINSADFLLGKGFNSDKKVIQKYLGKSTDIINSHSFFIQLIFYFGWFGFFLFIMFFCFLIIYAFINKISNIFFIAVIISQMAILNVSSSIIRMPIIWIPFFIIISYNLKDNNE